MCEEGNIWEIFVLHRLLKLLLKSLFFKKRNLRNKKNKKT